MPEILVCVAVIDGDQILLTKRDDFELWCLPGGGIEEGETVAQAAIRETKEETGIDIALSALVGIYSVTGADPTAHSVVFAGKKIGGVLKTQPGETIDVRFFPVNAIPDYLTPGHERRIADAFSGRGGSVVVHQDIITEGGQKLRREDIPWMRKLPRDERIAAFQQKLNNLEIISKMEVGT